jgi:hypothetical protein
MEISSGKRLFLIGLVVSLTATALLAIGILLFAEFDDTSARILATTGLIGLFNLLSLPASLLLDRGEARLLGYATIATAAIGLVLSFVLIWGEVDDDTATSWAVTIALAAGALLAVMLSWAAWEDVDDDTFYRFVGALAVADLLLVLLQPAVRRMGRASARTASRLVLTLDARPSEEAVAAAVGARAARPPRRERRYEGLNRAIIRRV